ncbi:hypothetical protein OH77DRAFT_940459 [Trametes cingulata]|nr:hypothetical protein OH77DRAFT_940459 [Trametes cingulata]
MLLTRCLLLLGSSLECGFAMILFCWTTYWMRSMCFTGFAPGWNASGRKRPNILAKVVRWPYENCTISAIAFSMRTRLLDISIGPGCTRSCLEHAAADASPTPALHEHPIMNGFLEPSSDLPQSISILWYPQEPA